MSALPPTVIEPPLLCSRAVPPCADPPAMPATTLAPPWASAFTDRLPPTLMLPPELAITCALPAVAFSEFVLLLLSKLRRSSALIVALPPTVIVSPALAMSDAPSRP